MASRATPPQPPQLICVMQMAPSLTSAASGPVSSSANASTAFQRWILMDQFLRSACRLRPQPGAMVFSPRTWSTTTTAALGNGAGHHARTAAITGPWPTGFRNKGSPGATVPARTTAFTCRGGWLDVEPRKVVMPPRSGATAGSPLRATRAEDHVLDQCTAIGVAAVPPPTCAGTARGREQPL